MIENILTYVWITVFTIALIISVISIFRWLGEPQKRARRLNILGFDAFAVLIISLLAFKRNTVIEVLKGFIGSNEAATKNLISACKITVKIFLMSTLVSFALLLTISILMFAVYGLWTILHITWSLLSKKDDAEYIQKDLESKEKRLISLFSNPLFIIILTGGILAIFFVIPLVVGSDSDSVAECWQSGIEKISEIAHIEENISPDFPGESAHSDINETSGNIFSRSLSLYMLIYIAILGIGFAAFNIIYEIIRNFFKKRDDESFWGQYSNPIGLLTVGISLLLMITTNRFDLPEDGKWIAFIANMLPPFIMVIVIVALGILSLEIVRLLLDIKETLIRNEARYLFILLIGQCTILIIRTLTMIYEAFSSILTNSKTQYINTKDAMEKVPELITEKVVEDIRQEIRKTSQNNYHGNFLYHSFSEKTTQNTDYE